MKHEILEKQVNILMLTAYNIIEQIDEIEKEHSLKFEAKRSVRLLHNAAKSASRELEKLHGDICEMSKKIDPLNYSKALEEMPKFSKRLDVALEKIYNSDK